MTDERRAGRSPVEPETLSRIFMALTTLDPNTDLPAKRST